MDITRRKSLFGALALFLAVAPVFAAGAQKPRPIDTLKYPKLNDIKMPAVERIQLPNGLKVILVEDHELPVVQMRALVRGGKVAEPAGKAGLSDLFGEAHRTGGVQSLSGDRVDEFLERIGASIESNVSDAYGSLSAKTLRENLDQVLPLYVEFLASPAFAEDKVDLAKTHLYSVIARRNDEVMNIARREILKVIYGAGSPYARMVEYADVDSLAREDLLAFHQKFYRPDNAILAVWGDFDAAAMKEKLAAAFGSWKASGPRPEIPEPFIFPPEPSVNYIEKKDIEQTFLFAGLLGLRLDDPDFPAVNMLSEILGGSMASRLFTQIRTLKGLAYGAGGFMVPAYDHPGAFYFFTSTKPSTTAKALETLLDELKKIRAEQVTDEELDRAKKGYLNSYAFEFDSTDKIVNRLLTYDFYGYPADFNTRLRDAIEKVTKDDVLAAAKKHLRVEDLAIVAIGIQEKFDRPLAEFGPVKTLDITIPDPPAKETLPEATPEALSRGQALLLSAAQAAGEKALRGLKDVATEGTASMKTPMGDMEFKVSTVFAVSGRSHSTLQTPMGTMEQVFDGGRAWMKMGPKVQDLPGSAAEEMARGIWFDSGAVLLYRAALDGKAQAQSLGKVSFEGQDAEEVYLLAPVDKVRLYLSPDGRTLLGSRRRITTQAGPKEMTEVYSDYRDAGGLKVPFSTVQKEGGEVAATQKVASVKLNAGFDPGLFERPSAAESK
ncbi:MAG: pitrilysin family protein [Acidobacteriota bacterium]